MFSLSPKRFIFCQCGVVNKSAENAAGHILCHAVCVILHSKQVALDRDTFCSTGILSFTLMSSLKCLATIHKMLQRDNYIAYLSPLYPLAEDSLRTTSKTQDTNLSCQGTKPYQTNYVFTTRQPNFRTIYLSLFNCYRTKLSVYRKRQNIF